MKRSLTQSEQIAQVAIENGGYEWLTKLCLEGFEVECLGGMIDEIGLHDPFVYKLYYDYSPSFAAYPAQWKVITDDESRIILDFHLNKYEGFRLVINKNLKKSTLWVKHIDNEKEWEVKEQRKGGDSMILRY